MKKIIVILGPTGVGKTSFAIRTAQAFRGEIIGADSMQVYRYMDIGTAKPSPEERIQVRHHLIDFLDPSADFDAGSYAAQAHRAIDDILERGGVPMVVGGTGFYIKALLYGLWRSDPICEKTLAGLTKELRDEGPAVLYRRLGECDPIAARRIHPNDVFRVLRALEVFQRTGRSISSHQQNHRFEEQRYESLKIGLTMDRRALYERIDKRVDTMLDQGLLKEVVSLVEKGYCLDLKSMQSIGYRHMGLFIRQQSDFEETVRLLKRDTRRYAKRQLTWFRKDPDILWLHPLQIEEAQKRIKEFLT